MIDIHTHILPGLDDGAANEEDALRLAHAAIAEGITTIIATPHHANGVYTNIANEVTEHVYRINERIKAAGMQVEIKPGQEIRVHDDLIEAWFREELLTLAGSRYILLEMPSSRIPKKMDELIHELQIMDLKPIIAHPERNAEIVNNPGKLTEWVEKGVYAQVTSHSLLGGFGKNIERTAWTLCRSGLIHFVSSDAHHPERRGFRLREAYSAVRERMGEQWENYFLDNAACAAGDGIIGSKPAVDPSSEGVWRRLKSYFYGR
jgi:protein-tyrosine phosphatase